MPDSLQNKAIKQWPPEKKLPLVAAKK